MDIDPIDHNHIWHPYSAMHSDLPIYTVDSAKGVRIKLKDGRELIDGMSSWWCAIHGYNHPEMNIALTQQLDKMAHIMFGGFTHTPAIELTRLLIEMSPKPLQTVFYSDSGSVAVEVAMKMAIQYWHAKGKPQRQRFVSLRCGYHGDTIGAMSVSDSKTGMHSVFNQVLQKNLFVAQPTCRFGEPCPDEELLLLKNTLENNKDIAALILEPIVQAAGGMWFYSKEYLQKARQLCHEFGVLFIADEIATGFARTGELFACNHADISPDIMCLGKTLTGGYLTLAATLATNDIAATIDSGDPGVFMHGPTFMANPLACIAALTSIKLLLASSWQENIKRIESGLRNGLDPCREFNQVKDVRILGAIGVVELKQPVDMKAITQAFVKQGVWLRPFGRLVYLMPPYIIKQRDLAFLCESVCTVLRR
ncbi:MAG: adenosylmethionine--8-amino-7-oxononanoate transaminase [Gammaproteobacteria bacterium]|nr:adenosylmethionine--8-amino-7-oxononanoate transaminase [Gammaproteobacteria bacterium]